MLPGKQYTLADIASLTWRRKWWLIVAFVLITSATIFVTSRLPNRYRSETVILVVPQRVPENYVRATVTSSIEDQLPSMRQQILSRTRLENIINTFNLYEKERMTASLEVAVEKMRRDINVEVVKQQDSFIVSYEAGDRVLAMKVTDQLASLFIQENLHERELLARETSSFLESQLEDARRRLVEQEKRLEEYRLRHAGELPSQFQSNLQAIQNTQLQIQSLGDSISRDRDRRLIIDREIADLRVESTPAAAPTPVVSTSASDLPDAPLAVQLESARNQLRSLQLRLKPEHPDVVRMKQLVEELGARVAQELEREAPAAPPPSAAEVLRRNRLRQLTEEAASLDRQIAHKTAEEQSLREVSAAYQARTETLPTRESELTALTRDYDTLQNSYKTLLSKREESKIAENLELRRVGVQFKILDQASLPDRPSWPKPLQFNLIGAAAGLLLGIGLVATLELLDKTLRSDSDVQAVLAVPVLATVPVIRSAGGRSRLRFRLPAYFDIQK